MTGSGTELVTWQRQDLNQSPRFFTITLNCLSDNKPRQTEHTTQPRSFQLVLGAREKPQREKQLSVRGVDAQGQSVLVDDIGTET